MDSFDISRIWITDQRGRIVGNGRTKGLGKVGLGSPKQIAGYALHAAGLDSRIPIGGGIGVKLSNGIIVSGKLTSAPHGGREFKHVAVKNVPGIG